MYNKLFGHAKRLEAGAASRVNPINCSLERSSGALQVRAGPPLRAAGASSAPRDVLLPNGPPTAKTTGFGRRRGKARASRPALQIPQAIRP